MKWLCLILLLAAALRFTRLADRPMHADEAIQADRFGSLLEKGHFQYDPNDYHGPALAYATLPVAWISDARTHAQLTEWTIRLVPAILGTLLVAISYYVLSPVGHRSALLAALFTTTSPAMTYFSRDYIPEALFVLLSAGTLAFILRQEFWAAGLCAGLMIATKETAVFVLVALAAGAAAANVRIPVKQGMLAAAIACVVLLSAFSVEGLADLTRAATIYAKRAFAKSPHSHSWHYYGGVLFSSADLAFPLVSMAVLFTRRFEDTLVRFLFVYSLTLTVLYSAIPYKTPWSSLGFLHGWILVASIVLGQSSVRQIVAAVAAIGLVLQAWRLSFPLATDTANPFAYAQTLPDVYEIRNRIASVPGRLDICSNENWWPLPWYLRNRADVRWLRTAPERNPAPLILVSKELEGKVAEFLYDRQPRGERFLYVNLFDHPVWLRPGVEVRGFLRLNGDSSQQ